MRAESNGATSSREIRALADDLEKAFHAKDVSRVMSHYAAEVVAFDLAPPLQYIGANALRQSLEDWFPTFRGPVGFEIRDLTIAATDDMAFSRSLNRISGTRTNGEETDVWVRATVCFRRTNGRWLVTHEHTSVPFYMDGSYRAVVDLKP